MSKFVAVVGPDYVGLPLATAAVGASHDIGGVEESGRAIAALLNAAERHTEAAFLRAGVEKVELSGDMLTWADGAVLLTDHGACDHDLTAWTGEHEFDTRNRCHGAGIEHL